MESKTGIELLDDDNEADAPNAREKYTDPQKYSPEVRNALTQIVTAIVIRALDVREPEKMSQATNLINEFGMGIMEELEIFSCLEEFLPEDMEFYWESNESGPAFPPSHPRQFHNPWNIRDIVEYVLCHNPDTEKIQAALQASSPSSIISTIELSPQKRTPLTNLQKTILQAVIGVTGSTTKLEDCYQEMPLSKVITTEIVSGMNGFGNNTGYKISVELRKQGIARTPGDQSQERTIEKLLEDGISVAKFCKRYRPREIKELRDKPLEAKELAEQVDRAMVLDRRARYAAVNPMGIDPEKMRTFRELIGARRPIQNVSDELTDHQKKICRIMLSCLGMEEGMLNTIKPSTDISIFGTSLDVDDEINVAKALKKAGIIINRTARHVRLSLLTPGEWVGEILPSEVAKAFAYSPTIEGFCSFFTSPRGRPPGRAPGL